MEIDFRIGSNSLLFRWGPFLALLRSALHSIQFFTPDFINFLFYCLFLPILSEKLPWEAKRWSLEAIKIAWTNIEFSFHYVSFTRAIITENSSSCFSWIKRKRLLRSPWFVMNEKREYSKIFQFMKMHRLLCVENLNWFSMWIILGMSANRWEFSGWTRLIGRPKLIHKISSSCCFVIWKFRVHKLP